MQTATENGRACRACHKQPIEPWEFVCQSCYQAEADEPVMPLDDDYTSEVEQQFERQQREGPKAYRLLKAED